MRDPRGVYPVTCPFRICFHFFGKRQAEMKKGREFDDEREREREGGGGGWRQRGKGRDIDIYLRWSDRSRCKRVKQ